MRAVLCTLLHSEEMPMCLKSDQSVLAESIDLSTIPPSLKVFLGFHVPANNGTGGAWIVVCEERGLLLDVVFVFIAE